MNTTASRDKFIATRFEEEPERGFFGRAQDSLDEHFVAILSYK